jgi:hypothetical protein
MGWLKALFGGGGGDKEPKALLPPADVYLGLRSQVLGLSQNPPPEAGDGALAILMETVHPPAVATLVGAADGTTSFYFSNGGGIIGSGGHPPVAAAAKAWLARSSASEFASAMSPTTNGEFPLPTAGQVRFYLVYPGRVLTAEAPEQDLVKKQNPLWPIFHEAKGVISQIRRHSPK